MLPQPAPAASRSAKVMSATLVIGCPDWQLAKYVQSIGAACAYQSTSRGEIIVNAF
jgi:hypothetical protein